LNTATRNEHREAICERTYQAPDQENDIGEEEDWLSTEDITAIGPEWGNGRMSE